jgi:Tol biopolymer transport system component
MTGRTIGHYEILDKLGEGGMGIVYKGRDVRLGRLVAIKVLSPDALLSADMRQRFIREARSASALSHPNIVTLHEIATEDACDFLVMEYVTGKSLQDIIRERRLSPYEAANYGAQIADALCAAHEAGVVHRDLKPSNVMVTDSGLVKVLDFGLAKFVAKTAEAKSDTTRTDFDLTSRTVEGSIIGTIAYMSPEQAEGRRVDQRSDIFSFGATLYEMLTGQKPFQGDSEAALFASVLRDKPVPVSRIVPRIPRELSNIVDRCMQKDPDRRVQRIEEVKLILEEIRNELKPVRPSAIRSAIRPPAARRRPLLAVLTGAAAVLLAAGAIWWFAGKSRPDESPFRAVVFTSYPGTETQPSFAPDGNEVAFAWTGEKRDNLDIYVKAVGSERQLRLTNDSREDLSPAWSPDGRFIAFVREGATSEFLLLPRLGGPERKIAETFAHQRDVPISPPYLCWHPSGKWLAAASKNSPAERWSLFLISTETGEQRRLTNPPPQSIGDTAPAFSPDGRSLAFVRSISHGASNVYVLPLSATLAPTGEPARLTAENRVSGPVWTANGADVLFSSLRRGDWTLWRIDAPRGRTLRWTGEEGDFPTISGVTHRLVYSRQVFDPNIWRIDLRGGSRSQPARNMLVSSTRDDSLPQFSPDGRRLAFQSNRSGTYEIWVSDEAGSNAVPVTSFGGPDTGTPRWSPDGNRIVFDSRPAGQSDIYVVNSQGGAPRQLTSNPADDSVPSFSHDGRWIYFASNRTGTSQIWKMPSEGGAAVALTKSGGYSPLEAPDGKFLFYAKSRDATSIWKIPVAGGEETQVVDSLSFWSNFAITSRGVYFIPTPDATGRTWIQFLEFVGGGITRVSAIEKPVYVGLAAAPDGGSLLYSQIDEQGSDLMLVENFR